MANGAEAIGDNPGHKLSRLAEMAAGVRTQLNRTRFAQQLAGRRVGHKVEREAKLVIDEGSRRAN